MERSINGYGILKTAMIFVLFFIIPIVFSVFIGYQSIGGYLSPLIILGLSWFFYKKEGKSLSGIGLNLKGRNLSFFPIGILLGILFFCLLLLFQLLYNGMAIHINKNVNYGLVFGSFLLLLQGVLNEELIFRGYCFKKTIEYLGLAKANLLFAFFFVVWHWIAFNAWGNYLLMLSLGITGLGHLIFAAALLESKTLYFPIGIHLGYNWAQRYLFSAGMTGINSKHTNDIIFILRANKQHFSNFHTIFSYLFTITSFLFFAWMIWKWGYVKSKFRRSIA